MGNINIDIPDELHHQLKVQAAQSGSTLKELVRDALSKGLKKRR